MGGSICVGIRRGDGTEYVAERWTNALPFRLSWPAFWADGVVTTEYLDAHLKDSYAERLEEVIPSSYGVVLIDFITKKVLSRNDYCGVASRVCGRLDQSDAVNLLYMIDHQWVTRYECWRHLNDVTDKNADERESDLNPEETQRFHEYLKQIAKNGQFSSGRRGRFDRGMVIVHWQVPGWSVDDRTNDNFPGEWPVVQNFLASNGWKTPACSLEKVIADYED
jgi:hypothetical protein